MSTKNASKTETASKNDAAPKSAGVAIRAVKAIKNKIFSTLPIGGSVKIAGLIQATEIDDGTYGTFTRFIGDFKVKFAGEIFIAPKMYLPEVAEAALNVGYNAAVSEFLKSHADLTPNSDDDEDTAKKKRKDFLNKFTGAEFGIILSKAKDTDTRNARGFQWEAKPLLAMAAPSDKYLALVSGE